MELNEKRISEKIIWLLVTFLFASFTIFDTNSWISIILLGITFIIFLLDIYQCHGKIKFKITSFHILILLFCLYCFVSSLWAIRPNQAISKGTTIFEILVCMSFIYMHYSRENTVKPLINAVMWAGYAVVIYAICFYGLSTIQKIVSAGERLENSFANINEIGMLGAMAIVITLYNFFFIDKRFKLSNIFIVPCIILVAASGSRKALIIVVFGLVSVIISKYSSKNILKNIFIWVILGILLFVFLQWASTLSIFEGVMSRMDGLFNLLSGSGKVDHSTWLRQQYINAGINQFKLHPIDGIGISSSGAILLESFGRDTYFHNNFVELLACGGLIGFFIYYNIYLYILNVIYRFNGVKEKYKFLCVIIIFILLFMDYASVSYYSKGRYFYFVILFLEIQFLRKSSRNKMGVVNEK